MKCVNEGQLQAYIDGELNEEEKKEIEAHLFQCEECKKTYKELKSINNFVVEKIEDYKKLNDKSNFNIEEFYVEKVDKNKGVFNNMKKYKKVAVAACAALVVTTCFTVQPIRAAISDAVSIFRANDIKSVNVSMSDIKELGDALQRKEKDINIDSIGKFKYEGGEYKNLTMEQAKKSVLFDIKLPETIGDRTIEHVGVTEPSKIDFTINVDNVNQIMTTLGAKKLFPKDIDGKTFNLDFKGSVDVSYNDKSKGKYVSVSQFKAPEINAPADVNVDELFDAVSGLSILPDNLQSQLKSMKDWKNTIYIPNADGKVEELNIDGMKAYGHFENTKDYKSSGVIFLKEGSIYAVNGNMEKNEIIEIVKSMR